MDKPSPQVSPAVRRKLGKLNRKRSALAKRAERMTEEDPRLDVLNEQYEKLGEQMEAILTAQPPKYDEEVIARGSVFLILDQDGSLREEVRIPKPVRSGKDANGSSNGEQNGSKGVSNSGQRGEALTPDDLSDQQIATALTHHAYAVRKALLGDEHLKLVVLAMVVHEKVRSDGLSIRHDANGSTLHAEMQEAFTSRVNDELAEARMQLDPFIKETFVEDMRAFEMLSGLEDDRLRSLIDHLIIALLTHRPIRQTGLLVRLARELKVQLRESWTPDENWFKRYRKSQLIGLLASFNGKLATPSADTKHGDLVHRLSELFIQAGADKLEAKLAKQVRNWCPEPLNFAKAGKR